MVRGCGRQSRMIHPDYMYAQIAELYTRYLQSFSRQNRR